MQKAQNKLNNAKQGQDNDMSTTVLANQIYSQQLLVNEESMLSFVDKSKSPAI